MENDKKIAMKVSYVSIVGNVLLSIFKFITGIVANSEAMVSDAVHSASDVFSTIIVIIGVLLSNKDCDDEHQYGHERLECVAAIILAILLAIVGLGIGYSGVKSIIATEYENVKTPGKLALIAAVISIMSKEAMYWYTRAAAKKINSSALMADAWHHRSDALSSVGAFIGILGARWANPILDPVASIVICVFIEKVALDVFVDAINKMVDKSCETEIVNEMKNVILQQKGVEKIDLIKTRLFGSKIYVEIEIGVDGELKLKSAHDIAEVVHDEIEQKFPLVKHCMVHVNPC